MAMKLVLFVLLLFVRCLLTFQLVTKNDMVHVNRQKLDPAAHNTRSRYELSYVRYVPI